MHLPDHTLNTSLPYMSTVTTYDRLLNLRAGHVRDLGENSSRSRIDDFERLAIGCIHPFPVDVPFGL